MYKHTQGIGTVLQHIVHAAPYDHIGFFFCKIFYNLRLIAENIFIRNKFLTVRLNQLSPVKSEDLLNRDGFYLFPPSTFQKVPDRSQLSSEAIRMISLS